MKRYTNSIFAFLNVFSLMLLGCGGANESETSVKGWYTMQSQVFTANGVDYVVEKTEQRKVYADEYYIYSNMSEDTTSSFGFGFYTFDGKKLVETNIFSTGILDTARSFDLFIEKHEAGYKQVIPEIVIKGVPNKIVEDYYKINFDKKADIDGVWKLDEFLSINNGDTARSKRNQYKIFEGGYFMSVQYYIDPKTNARKKGFSFGNFELGKQEINETNVFSSTPETRGVAIQTKLTRESEDSFTQTSVSSTNGSISIEKYIRMPKVSKSTSNP